MFLARYKRMDAINGLKQYRFEKNNMTKYAPNHRGTKTWWHTSTATRRRWWGFIYRHYKHIAAIRTVKWFLFGSVVLITEL